MDKKTNNIKKSKFQWLLLIACGLLIGFINGFFGGGGGLIAVPVLEKSLGLKTKTAHATAILVILPISLLSAIIYVLNGKFQPLSGFTSMAGIVAGGIVGALMLSKLSNRIIRIIFTIVMAGVGCKLLFG